MSKLPGEGWTNVGVFQLGKGKTLAVPMEVHQQARKKLVESFKKASISSGIVLLQGGDDQTQYDSDTELVFRQDSWFNNLFGVKEAAFYGAISIETGKCTLFMPRLPESYNIWCGSIRPASDFQVSYAVDEVLYVEELSNWLESSLSADLNSKIYLMKGVNSDSGLEAKPASFTNDNVFITDGKVNYDVLYNILSLCRVTKSKEEVEVMRYCAFVASNAHVEVMRNVKISEFEYELEAKFLYEIYKNGGCRKSAYTSICGCGPNSAVLHYGHAAAPNDRALSNNDMALLDMGAEYHGYVSDITCSYPVSGKFTNDQKVVFEGVLNAQIEVLNHMKPGSLWIDCHLIAEKEILKALETLGIVKGGKSIDEYVECALGAVFFPHGLGHLIGCDTHDVGGYLPDCPPRHIRPGLSKLRTARVLEVGMVMTNEPGCYFIDYLLDQALADPIQGKLLNAERLNEFRGFGGVRLEDVVLVTETGVENLTTCPRTVEEVESVLNGGPWPPVSDKAPSLRRKWTKLADKGLGMVEVNIPII